MTGALDALEYRRVVGRFATGVTIVTTVLDGDDFALTANSFTSVSLDPFLVLFCPERISRFHDAVLTSGSFAVSVLSEGQQAVSRRFAVRGRPLEGQFDDVPHTRGPVTGSVLVSGALSTLECRTTSTTAAGDHTVVIGEVLGLGVPSPTAAPLLYYEGRYGAFSSLTPAR